MKFILQFFLLAFFIGCMAQSPSNDFPILLQEDSVECGPVCLKMICQYYNKEIDLDSLKIMTKMDESGTSLMGLSDAADELGLRSVAAKVTYKQLYEKVPLPAILHLDGNHFVVIYYISKTKINIADPILGLVEYSKDELLERWQDPLSKEGIVMMFEVID